jgi:hypothetical protein
MKLALVGFVVAGLCFGQRGGPVVRTGGVLYPGARGANRSPGGRYIVPAPVTHSGHARGVLVPIPVYYGAGYYGYDPSIPMGAQSAPAYDSDPGNYAVPNQSPVVVINQSYAPDTSQDQGDPNAGEPPTLRSFDATTSAVRDPQPTIYLIALQDHSIVAAIGYWVTGDTLNYITQDGTQNQISLSLIDRDFSKQLNDDRHIEFRLPKTN